MIYNTPVKGEDGLYFVKALNDNKRKCFVQLNKVSVADVSDEIVFDLLTDTNTQKIEAVDTQNLTAAQENCVDWFGKSLSEKVIHGAYTSGLVNGQITGDHIAVTKIFNSEQVSQGSDILQTGDTCDVILEFAGLWFAKKAFGPTWNVVQVKIRDAPVPTPESDPDEDTYPDEYAFVDEDEE
jgi:hypothetical protein